MTVRTLIAPFPDIAIGAGMRLRLEAIDPTTGAAVTGVTASEWAIYGIDLSDVIGDVLTDVIPPLTPEEIVLD